jgi:hypothetical protein
VKIRIEQQNREPADLTAMRCFAKAIPHSKRRELIAAAEWMLSIVKDPKTKTADEMELEYQI